jgi:hypothetical protein
VKTLVMLLIALTAGAWGSGAADAAQPILVVNQSTLVTDEQIQDALPAFQLAVTRDFAPVWGTDATLTTDPATADAWTVTITDEPDVLFAAGYHYLDHGRPAAKVFADSMPWQLVLTHELFEMLVDPWLNRSVRAHGKWWLVEVGDPVETRSYQLPSASGLPVSISDFVTPAWYRPGTRGPFDHNLHVKRPLQLLAGGYAAYWSELAGGWTGVFAANSK